MRTALEMRRHSPARRGLQFSAHTCSCETETNAHVLHADETHEYPRDRIEQAGRCLTDCCYHINNVFRGEPSEAEDGLCTARVAFQVLGLYRVQRPCSRSVQSGTFFRFFSSNTIAGTNSITERHSDFVDVW